MTDAAMFDPLPGAGKRDPRSDTRARGWQVVIPVPADAPPPPKAHPTRGVPAARWTYRDPHNALLGYVTRFDGDQGAKDFLPLTWWSATRVRHPLGRW